MGGSLRKETGKKAVRNEKLGGGRKAENSPVTTKNSRLREGVLDLGSDAAVGEQHELLDETVGLEHLLLLDVDRIGRLRTVEVN